MPEAKALLRQLEVVEDGMMTLSRPLVDSRLLKRARVVLAVEALQQDVAAVECRDLLLEQL